MMRKITITYMAFCQVHTIEFNYNTTMVRIHKLLSKTCSTYQITNIEI